MSELKPEQYFINGKWYGKGTELSLILVTFLYRKAKNLH